MHPSCTLPPMIAQSHSKTNGSAAAGVSRKSLQNSGLENAFWRRQGNTAPYAQDGPVNFLDPAYRAGFQGYAQYGKNRTSPQGLMTSEVRRKPDPEIEAQVRKVKIRAGLPVPPVTQTLRRVSSVS